MIQCVSHLLAHTCLQNQLQVYLTCAESRCTNDLETPGCPEVSAICTLILDLVDLQ